MLIAGAWADFENWALNALPVFEIFFLLAMVSLLALVVRTMPRTKPQEIKPDSVSSVGWEDIAGAELGELLGAAQELDDLLEFLAGVLDAGDVLPGDRAD